MIFNSIFKFPPNYDDICTRTMHACFVIQLQDLKRRTFIHHPYTLCYCLPQSVQEGNFEVDSSLKAYAIDMDISLTQVIKEKKILRGWLLHEPVQVGGAQLPFSWFMHFCIIFYRVTPLHLHSDYIL